MSMQSMRSEASAGLVSGGQSRVPDTCSFGIYKGNRVAVRNIQCGPVTLTRANLLELKMVTGNGFTNWSEILMEHFREHCSINFNSTWQTHHPVAIIFVMRIHHNAIRLLAVYLWIYCDCAVSAIWARVLMKSPGCKIILTLMTVVFFTLLTTVAVIAYYFLDAWYESRKHQSVCWHLHPATQCMHRDSTLLQRQLKGELSWRNKSNFELYSIVKLYKKVKVYLIHSYPGSGTFIMSIEKVTYFTKRKFGIYVSAYIPSRSIFHYGM